MHHKIACSLNNSVAIGDKGQIYVWGSGKYGLTASFDLENRVIPTDININKINPYYRAQHVSCGLYHMAAIVRNSIIDKIDIDRKPIEIFQKIINKHKIFIKDNNIDILKAFETSEDGFVESNYFKLFIETTLICEYSNEEKENLEEFINYFSLENEDKSNLLQYYYYVNDDQTYYTVFIWGISDNGRLGLEEDVIKRNLFHEQNLQLKSNFSEINGNKRDRESLLKSDEEIKSDIDEGNEEDSPYHKLMKENKKLIIKPTKIDFKLNNQIHISKISCGHHHTMALEEPTGSIYTWGMGSQGCLGNGLLADVHEPRKILPVSFEGGLEVKFKDICCGAYHSMALSITEDIYSWGSNSRGQLGHGDTSNILTPKKIQFFSFSKISLFNIDAGDQHSAAISNANELYTWGCGTYYRLGHGVAFDQRIPKKVEVLEDVYVKRISCGASHTLCITNEGFIYGWGNGMCGKLGIEEKCTKNYIVPTRVGTYLPKFRRKQFVEVRAGPLHSLTLTEEGMIYVWGSSKNGVLGLGRRNEDVYLPEKISKTRFHITNLVKKIDNSINFMSINYLQQFYQPDVLTVGSEFSISALVCGDKNTFFLTDKGKLFCSGSNHFGLMARDPRKVLKTTNPAILKAEKSIAAKSPNETHTNIDGSPTKSNYSVITAKSNKDSNSSVTPILINYFKKPILFIACSYNHAIAINNIGRVFTWGSNADYQLGLGFPSKYEFVPHKLSGALETKIVKMASCGEKFSALLTDSGEVWTFGTSEQGSLGHEEKNSYIIPIPKMINDIPKMIFINCGPTHMMSVSVEDRELYAWGSNLYGQLGANEDRGNADMQIFKPRVIPLIYSDFHLKVEMVNCGMFHSVILTTDHSVMSSGLKKYAGLNRADISQNFEAAYSFEMIPALKPYKFKFISVGEFHSLALTENGEIYGWGNTTFGKLGENNWKPEEEINYPKKDNKALIDDLKCIILPRKIFSQKNINKSNKFIACGSTHSAFLDILGKAYVWGSSVSGKLGVKNKNFNNEEEINIIGKSISNPNQFVIAKPTQVLFAKSSNEGMSTNMSPLNPTHSPNKSKDFNKSGKLSITNNIKGSEIDVNSVIDDNKSSSEGMIQEKSSLDSEDNFQDVEEFVVESPSPSIISKRKGGNESALTTQTQNQNKQDKLQKELLNEKAENKEERLMAEDNELEKRLRELLEIKLNKAISLGREYNMTINRVDSVIYGKLNIESKNNNKLPFLDHIQHKVPTFVLQNIQLYETMFSFLRLHPCYLMKIIKTHLLNNSQVNQLINILYNNPTSSQSSICSLISLSQMIFEYEVAHYFKITEIRNFKIGSIFWQIYLITFLKQNENKKFLVDFASFIINELFCKHYVDTEKLNTDKFKDCKEETLKIMQHALERRDEGKDTEKRIKSLQEHLLIIIKSIWEKFHENINNTAKSNKNYLTKEIVYLHGSIIKIYKDSELEKFKLNFNQSNEFDLKRDDKKKIENELKPFNQKLDTISENFIRNLYFGILVHIIQNYKNFDVEINKEYLPFVDKSNNLKILSDLIERFFNGENFHEDKEYDELNKYIKKPNEKNKLLFKKLAEYDYYNLTLNHLLETMKNYFDYRVCVYEIPLEFLFILHNLYCKSIKSLGMKKDILLREKEDPLYIILHYLDFEEISINEYNTDTLRMNINLRSDPKSLLYSLKKESEHFSFYSCQDCHILLPKNLLSSQRSHKIDEFERNAWNCEICKHKNSVNDFRCKFFSNCHQVIKKEIFDCFSIIEKYYQENDELQYLFLDILNFIDNLRETQDVYDVINETLKKAQKNEDIILTAKIKKFKLLLEEEIKITHEQIPIDFKDKYFKKKCMDLKVNGEKLIEKRNNHRQYQLYLTNILVSLDALTKEKILSYKGAIDDLKIAERNMLEHFVIDKNNINYNENENNLHEQFFSFGAYTSNELFQNKSLKSCKFTNMEITKILKHLKFFIYSTGEGGFSIKVVYLNEHWFNIFIGCLKSYAYNEVTLQTMEISLEKYIELKRTASYKTICTLGNEKISASFNVFYLIKILRDIESQILVKYNTLISKKNEKNRKK